MPAGYLVLHVLAFVAAAVISVLVTRKSRKAGIALAAFEGIFEGWASATRVRAAVADGRLEITIDDGEPRPAELVADKSFVLKEDDAEIALGFFGRAGTIEGLVLRRPGHEPESLRHSVAEPVDLAELAEHLASVGEDRPGEPTVHWPSFRGTNASGIGDGADTHGAVKRPGHEPAAV